jgi:choline transport protein
LRRISGTYIIRDHADDSEETHHAARDVPRAMVGAVFINGMMGFVWVITLLYVSPDLDTVLADTDGTPLITILSASFKNLGGTIFVELLLIYIGLDASIGLTASASRMTWAFARDNGFPFHLFLKRVNPKWGVPVNCIAIITVIQILVCLINFGNSTALQAILSIATIAILFTYLVPPAFMLLYARRRISDYGPFRLGKFGIFLNVVSCGFTLLFFVLLNFPTVSRPPFENIDVSPILLRRRI